MKDLPKRKSIRLAEQVYSVYKVFSITIGVSDRYPWFELYPGLADTAMRLLIDLASERRTALYAWCVMPDHVHLLLQDRDLVEFIRLFKGKMTPQSRALEPTRALWQESFYDRCMRTEESLTTVAVYIWRNPVRAGLVDQASDYRWSGSSVWPEWRKFLL
jgi:REP element-mobilizing transposase RayT